MATDTARTQTENAENDQYIDQKIQSTAQQVKLVSLATSVTTLLVGVVAYLLLLSFIDHWIWGFNVWARLLALVVLLTGTAAFFVLRILPGLIRTVNPVFAAQTIENSTPTLKNSLINFLLLRDHQSGTRQVILDGVKRQAVGDLHHVPVNTVVDRSELIRIGYVLAVLVVLFGVYRVFSPKDPFQTVARVATPWKTIARPSRAKIEQVVPGNTEIYRGHSVDIEAIVTGLRDDEAVQLVFSTIDGRMVDRTIDMLRSESGRRYQMQLTTGPGGIQDDLNYFIHAGDAQTETYRVTVKDAPSIDVNRLTLKYPAYTKRPEEQIEQQGDIAALEGTRVRIEALANQPIRSASLELFDGESSEPVKILPMRHTEDRAHGSLTLKLNADGKTPVFTGYQLRFINRDGHRNPEPVRYQIDVVRDLPPLVEIISPRRREIELPVNQRLMIEVRALDPDFALSNVRLHGAAGGLELLKHSFLTEPHEGQGIFVYQFRPDEIGLVPGDTLVYWAEAEDNRRALADQTDNPNLARSGNYRIRVTEPQVTEEQEADDSSAENQPQQEGEGGEDAGEEGGGGEGGEQQGNGQGESTSDSSEEGASGEADGSGTGNEISENSDERGNEPSGESQGSGNGENSTGDSQSNEANESSDVGEGQGGKGEGQQDSEQTGSESQGSEGDQQTPAGGGGDEQGEPDDREPVASDGSNDGDAFDRILEHQREKEEEQKNAGSGESNDGESSSETSDSDSNDSTNHNAQSTGSESQEKLTENQESADAGDRPTTDAGDSSEDPNLDESKEQTGNPADGGSESTNNDADDEPQIDQTGRGSQETASEQPNTEPADDTRDAENDRQGGQPANDDPEATDREPRESDADGNNPREQQPPGENAQPSSEDDPQNPSQSDDGGEAGEQGTDATENSPSQNSEANEGQPRNNDPQDGDNGSQTTGGNEATQPESQADGEQDTSDGSGSNSSQPNDSPGASESDSDAQAKTGGNPSDGTGSPGESEAGEPGEDEVNLEYAREATDLALEHLREQQDNRELLDRLGWTPEEARRFLQRWQEMKQSARQPDGRGQRAQRDMNDRLQGLGLRPQQGRTRVIEGNDRVTGLREGGTRSAPPAQYREHYRAFLRGLGQDSQATSESK